ncbi:MAG: hypothetical protein HYY97_15850 [Rhodocyclales bacterium]|nr:hypothetical protein [Rhodocyclales bacterium]
MAGKTAAEFLRSFERSGFMVDVTWTSAGSAAAAVTFKALYQDAQSEVRFGMVTADEPVVTFETAYCPLLTNGDQLEIGGAFFKVRDGGNFKDATARRFRVRKVSA